MNPLSQYAAVIQGVTVALAIIGWATVYIIYKLRDEISAESYIIKGGWCLHATLFFTGVAIARLFFGYVGPSVVVTSWTHALFLHAFIAMASSSLAARAVTHGVRGLWIR